MTKTIEKRLLALEAAVPPRKWDLSDVSLEDLEALEMALLPIGRIGKPRKRVSKRILQLIADLDEGRR